MPIVPPRVQEVASNEVLTLDRLAVGLFNIIVPIPVRWGNVEEALINTPNPVLMMGYIIGSFDVAAEDSAAMGLKGGSVRERGMTLNYRVYRGNANFWAKCSEYESFSRADMMGNSNRTEVFRTYARSLADTLSSQYDVPVLFFKAPGSL